MVNLSYYDPWYNTALTAHRSFGLVVLGLALGTLFWNVYSSLPEEVTTLKRWERITAPVVHRLLYVMMIVIPLSGYLISTSEGASVSLFGWIDIPATYVASESIRELLIKIHAYAAYTTGILACGHGLAALKHHLIDRDATLRRML